MRKRRDRLVVLCGIGVAVAILLAGCTGAGDQAVVALVPLQVQLAAEYGGSNVVVALEDGSTLSVTKVVDPSESPLRAFGADRARELAEFVCKRYGSIDQINRVEVTLEGQREGSLVGARVRVAHSFARDDLACGDR